MRLILSRTIVVSACLLLAAPSVSAGQSVREVLGFLVTNRSIPTDDFVRDEEAAQATSDAIAEFLTIELGTLPIASSASGFIYRLDPALGTISRVTDSFGPFFTERSLTLGRARASFSLGVRSVVFDTIDGRDLDDHTLVSTASTIRGEAQPFDVETVALDLRLDTVTAAIGVGITDRLEIGGAVPMVRVRLEGERLDNYRGRIVPQASGTATASGIGDVVLRAKYNVVQRTSGGLAVGAEGRLPTGDEEQLLGAGRASVKPRLVVSFDRSPVSIDGDVGYSLRGVGRALEYSGSLSVAATPRLTVIGELIGRRLEGVGQLVDIVQPHPRLLNVDTIRLTSVDETTSRLSAVAGFKWNVAGSWLLSANVLRPLTTTGLTASWVPTISLDYAFGQ